MSQLSMRSLRSSIIMPSTGRCKEMESIERIKWDFYFFWANHYYGLERTMLPYPCIIIIIIIIIIVIIVNQTFSTTTASISFPFYDGRVNWHTVQENELGRAGNCAGEARSPRITVVETVLAGSPLIGGMQENLTKPVFLQENVWLPWVWYQIKIDVIRLSHNDDPVIFSVLPVLAVVLSLPTPCAAPFYRCECANHCSARFGR